jgi:hypothetical protein
MSRTKSENSRIEIAKCRCREEHKEILVNYLYKKREELENEEEVEDGTQIRRDI